MWCCSLHHSQIVEILCVLIVGRSYWIKLNSSNRHQLLPSKWESCTGYHHFWRTLVITCIHQFVLFSTNDFWRVGLCIYQYMLFLILEACQCRDLFSTATSGAFACRYTATVACDKFWCHASCLAIQHCFLSIHSIRRSWLALQHGSFGALLIDTQHLLLKRLLSTVYDGEITHQSVYLDI